MTYATLLEKLYTINTQGQTKYNLDTMLQLCTLFGSPEKKFPSIHIAGTNGKGSVTTKMAKTLELSGLKVGLYTSPHISCFRERIRLNGQMISEAETMTLLTKILNTTEQYGIKASFFEMTTLLAFCYYAEQKVDVAVIETGLGGRLDATNIITPLLSIITSISLEHTNILGNTLSEIAREKAGIIKPHIPIVIGPRVPFYETSSIATALKAPLYHLKDHFATYDEENSAIAKKGLELLNISTNYIIEGCKAMPPCRMEQVVISEKCKKDQPPKIILDVAHNPDGFEKLFLAIRKDDPLTPLRIVCGLSANKEITACVNILKQQSKAFHLVQANTNRALPQQMLHQEFIDQGVPVDHLFLANSIQEAMHKALELATLHQEILVVCGSFYIMAPIRASLGIIEPIDPFDLNHWSLEIKTIF